jgi:hypothetical protein
VNDWLGWHITRSARALVQEPASAERPVSCSRPAVHVAAMYYWQDAAQAHRVVERGIPGEVVLIVDDDLAAALEV